MFDAINLTTPANKKYVSAQNSSCCYYDRHCYVFGGFDGEIANNVLFKYSLVENTFEQLFPENRPLPRYQHSACIVDDKMYIYGGKNDAEVFDDLWAYDFKENKFTKIDYEYGRMRPSALYGHSAFAISPCEFMIIGGTKQNTKPETVIYTYNIQTNIMTQQLNQDGPAPAIGQSIIQMGDSTYLFGGVGLKGFQADLWKYRNRKWT